MSAWEEWFRLDFQVGLIRGNGVVALVNTGPADDLTPMNDLWAHVLGERARMRRAEEWKIVNQLARVGVEPTEVTHVIVTPLQLYATANIHRFPNAQICLSREGWIHYHTTHDHPHDKRWNCIARDTLQHLVIEAWDRVRLLECEDEIAPGIRTWWAGGHHRATLAVDVDTPAGGAVLSDVFFSFRNVTANHPIGICENIYEALAAYERARATARHIIPLYEPLVFDRYPDGVIAASA